MAFGGRVDRIPEAALEAAGELAASQGWAGAAESISGRLALTVSK
jgi:hypothetical protein